MDLPLAQSKFLDRIIQMWRHMLQMQRGWDQSRQHVECLDWREGTPPNDYYPVIVGGYHYPISSRRRSLPYARWAHRSDGLTPGQWFPRGAGGDHTWGGAATTWAGRRAFGSACGWHGGQVAAAFTSITCFFSPGSLPAARPVPWWWPATRRALAVPLSPRPCGLAGCRVPSSPCHR